MTVDVIASITHSEREVEREVGVAMVGLGNHRRRLIGSLVSDIFGTLLC